MGNYENIVRWSELGSGYMDECDELMDFILNLIIYYKVDSKILID